MQNTVALGALIFLLGLDFDIAASVLADTFSHKGKAVIDQNVGVAQGRLRIRQGALRAARLSSGSSTGKRRPYLTGNEAFSIGAVAAGCRFYSAYPMTPASGILTWMADHAERCGVVVKQMEDELAVANVAIGAGYAGARAMCATSGGGFALMTEAIGMAGMIEAPVVFIEVQRGGPSTGIPTKTGASRSEPGVRRVRRAISRASSSRPRTRATASIPPSKPSTSPRNISAR